MRNFVAILVFLLSFNAFSVEVDLTGPRQTFKTFLKSMVEIKNSPDKANDIFPTVLETLDIKHFDSKTRDYSGRKVAKDLINTLDRLEKVDYKKIPTKYNHDIWMYTKRNVSVDGESYSVEISLSKDDKGKWRFSRQTVDTISHFARSLKDQKVISDVVTYTDWKTKIKKKMPEWTGRRSFILLNGQWIGIFLLIFLGIVIDRVSRFFLTKLILARLKTKHLKLNSKEAQKIKFPFGILTISIVWFVGIHLLEFNDSTLSIMVRLGHILFAISLTWVMGQIVTLVSEYFAQIADQTENKLDDILIPMLTKAARVFVYCIGAVFVAHSLTIDVTNIVAGLGIGGLAFALAAKDTLSNLFGSVTVVLDRPFHIGDWVKIGNDIEGTVVQVGFRSTRIRTFYDSIITIPNNQLTNVHIDNMNQRQYRRYLTHVTVQYDTSPEKIEAYCEGIRKIIASYETTRKDYFNVYLNNMSSSSLDILVQVYWIVPDYAAECSERHRLLVDIIRLANELDIDFAFPTRTLHLYNEQQADRKENPLGKNADNYYQWGSEEANKLVANSISHKESRSSQDSLS